MLGHTGECFVAVKADCDYRSKTELPVRLVFISAHPRYAVKYKGVASAVSA